MIPPDFVRATTVQALCARPGRLAEELEPYALGDVELLRTLARWKELPSADPDIEVLFKRVKALIAAANFDDPTRREG